MVQNLMIIERSEEDGRWAVSRLRAAVRRAILESNGDGGEASERLVEWLARADRGLLSSVLEELEQEGSGMLYPEALDGAARDALVEAEWDEAKAERILAERMDQRENPTFHQIVKADAIEHLALALGRLLREELERWHQENQTGR